MRAGREPAAVDEPGDEPSAGDQADDVAERPEQEHLERVIGERAPGGRGASARPGAW